MSFLLIVIIAAIGVGFSGLVARPLFSVAATYLVVAALAVVLVVATVLAGPIGLAAALGAEAVLVGGFVAASSRRGYTGRHSAGYRPRHAA